MGGRASVVVLVVALAGCLESEAHRCASGLLCPPGSVCDDVNDRCVSDDQVAACDGVDEGDPCMFGGANGLCEDGVCVADTCGDGRVTGSEDCEPELAITVDCMTLGYYEPGGLACGEDCRFDVSDCVGECGDGVRNGPEPCEGNDHGGEDCEDFGYYDPDGIVCNPASCTFDLTGCSGRCGDGVIDTAEGESCEGSPPIGTCLEFGFDAGSLRCSGFCTPGFDACGELGWRRESTSAPTAGLHGVWASSLDDIYLVGYQGTIVHGHSGSWTTENIGALLHDVHGFGSDVFAVGNGGQILKRAATDPPVWNPMDTGGALSDYHGIWGVALDDLWAVGEEIVHFDGTDWTRLGLPGGAGTLYGIHGSGPDDIWAVGEGGTIVHWDTTSWTEHTSPTTFALEAVWASGPADAWAVGREILHWDGTAWTIALDPGGEPLTGIWGANRDDVTAVGNAGSVFHWDGVTWSMTTQDLGSPGDVFGLSGMLLVASSGAIGFRAEATWQASPVVVPTFEESWMAAPDDVWAVELVDGTLHHWDGKNWALVVLPASFQDVWGAAWDDVWAVGGSGALWHYDGVGWSSRPDAGSITLTMVWGNGPDDVWAFGGANFLHWNGTTWTDYPQGGVTSFSNVWGSGPDDIWIIGGFGVIRHFDGSSWIPAETPLAYENFVGLWGTAQDDVWALSGTGLLFHFDGTAWSAPTSLLIDSSVLWGSAPDDLLVVGNLGRALHFDGVAWAPIRPQVDWFPRTIWGDRAGLVIAGEDAGTGLLTHFDRHTRWACRTRETACGDAIDDDCDERVDGDDDDCLGGVAIAEVHGGAEDYIELVNRTGATASLAGLTVDWSHGCSSGSHTLDRRAVVRDGEPYRVIRDRTPGTREQWSGTLCDAPDAGGWVMLCAGECDRVACSNVLDFVAKTGTSAPAGVPSCAGMVPAPVSVTGATAAQSLTRIGFTGAGPKGVQSDWELATATRD